MSQVLDNSNLDARKIYSPPSSSTDLGRLTARIALHIRQSLDLENILKSCVQEIRQVLNADRAIIYRFEEHDPTIGKIVIEDVVSPWKSILGKEIKDECLAQAWHHPFSIGIALAIEDVERVNAQSCYHALIESLQVKANVVASIVQDQRLWGLLIVHHCRSPRHWTDQEVQLLQHIGIQLGIAIQQAELYRQLQDHNKQLEAAKTRLELVLERETSLSDLKSNFLALTSHEFRTPMTTIRSSAELLESFECDPEDKKLLFRQIHNAIDYMVKMLDDIRFMSRRTDEQKPLKPQILNLNRLIDELSSHLRSILNCKHECRVFCEDLAKPILLDEKLTRQILENLISNAMKYSPHHPEIEVRISSQINPEGRGGVLLEVQDYGMGIPDIEQEHIYETFYRAKNVAGMKGTGLGLAIVKRCVELSGGTIALESQVTQGSCFRVFLPCLDPFSE
jgi:signal transduction histidine kinase